MACARSRSSAGQATWARSGRPSPEEIGLLDESELAAELGLTGNGDLEGFGFGDGDDGAAFADELADLATPPDDGGSKES